MNTAVTLNGADNVGKTTNARWLASAVPDAIFTGTIDRWDRRWEEVSRGDFSRWWFVDSTTADHVDLVFTSYAGRAKGGGSLAVEDRGWPMLVATCAATASVKDGIPIAQALAEVEARASRHTSAARREVHILLRHTDQSAAEAGYALARDRVPATDRYAAYQRRLAEAIELQADRGVYQAVVVRGERPLLDVQRQIRETVARFGVPVASLAPDRVDRLWVLAGMSESGKSTVGELLRTDHSVTRLKIGYLLRLAADRFGVADPYLAWDQVTEAQRLSEEVLRFAALNPGSRRISVESAHRFEATAHLRRIWGDRCTVVYLDAPQQVRLHRANEPADSLADRDAIKRSRGADDIASIADTVIDNGGSLAGLKRAVAEVVYRNSGSWIPPHLDTVVPAPVQPLLADCAAALVDSGTALVAVTGSLGYDGWQPGWSDIDLLVVRDTLPLNWLRDRRLPDAGPAGEKIAVSAFTTHEVCSGLLPPRLLYALRQIAREGRGLLYRRNGLVLHVADRDVDERAARADLPLVVMVLRRLAARPALDVRAVYKHVVLIMKIILRADGIDLDASDDVRHAFAAGHREAAVDLPAVVEVGRAGQHPDKALALRVRAAAASILAYHDALGHSGTNHPTPPVRKD
ncbi:hypothetical protein [Micromonospora sp. SH-82]|uniref:hypothetical protein n=1 Tax=Micromonospora sp. SH-82 TaxID=3132938 RepID=UPI003EBB78BE